MQRTTARWLYVPLYILSAIFAILGVYLTIRDVMSNIKPSQSEKKQLDKIDSRINMYYDVYQEKMENVRSLVNAHEFLQAALLLDDLAATERTLVGQQKRFSPLPDEKEAMTYMKEAGYGEIYRAYAHLRYPTAFQDEDISKDQAK
jgi:hypothetical protein